MAWGDPADLSLTTTELQYVLPALYVKKTLEVVKEQTGLWDKLDRQSFTQRSGTTANFSKYAKTSGIATIQGGTLTQGTNPATTDLVTGRTSAAIVEYGGVYAVPDLASLTVIDGAEIVGELVGEWAKEAMEYYAQITFTPYLQQVRVDGDSTYEVDSVTTSAGSTVLVNDTARAESTNSWAGALLTITDKHKGAYGESQFVASNIQSTSITVGTAFSQTIGSGWTYRVSIPTAITSADVLSLTGLRLAQKAIRRKQGMGAGFEIKGGGYWGVYDADLEAQILADTTLLTLFTHTEKEADGIRGYNPGKLMMIRPILSSAQFQCAVTGAGTYSSTGVCHIMPIFGPAAGAIMPLTDKEIEIIAKGKKEIGGALERFSTAGFKVQLAIGKKNMMAGCGLVCGA
jgi:hypothetical protein